MSLIKKTIDESRTAEIEYPSIEGFIITLKFISREALTKIRNNSLVFKFNKNSHIREEVVDNDKFLSAYSQKVIKGWKGLKVKHLPSLYPANIESLKADDLVEYTEEDALELLKVSTEFDAFITDAMADIATFEEYKKEVEIKN